MSHDSGENSSGAAPYKALGCDGKGIFQKVFSQNSACVMKIHTGKADLLYQARIHCAQTKLRRSGNDCGYGNSGHPKSGESQEAEDKDGI